MHIILLGDYCDWDRKIHTTRASHGHLCSPLNFRKFFGCSTTPLLRAQQQQQISQTVSRLNDNQKTDGRAREQGSERVSERTDDPIRYLLGRRWLLCREPPPNHNIAVRGKFTGRTCWWSSSAACLRNKREEIVDRPTNQPTRTKVIRKGSSRDNKDETDNSETRQWVEQWLRIKSIRNTSVFRNNLREFSSSAIQWEKWQEERSQLHTESVVVVQLIIIIQSPRIRAIVTKSAWGEEEEGKGSCCCWIRRRRRRGRKNQKGLLIENWNRNQSERVNSWKIKYYQCAVRIEVEVELRRGKERQCRSKERIAIVNVISKLWRLQLSLTSEEEDKIVSNRRSSSRNTLSESQLMKIGKEQSKVVNARSELIE